MLRCSLCAGGRGRPDLARHCTLLKVYPLLFIPPMAHSWPAGG